MAQTLTDYEQWREADAERLIATGGTDIDAVRELLVLSCRSSPLADRFFECRLSSEPLLSVLLGLAVEDYSSDAQMTASYWVSRFPRDMLVPHAAALAAVAANEWESVSVHARKVLEAVTQQRPAKPDTAAADGHDSFLDN